ncbi:MAG: peptidoglycan DD-metalloendopeptidase family protein [Bacteroidota bacterium]
MSVQEFLENVNCQPIVHFDKNNDRLLLFDFTEANKELTADIIDDTARFSDYIHTKRQTANARFGIGGYDEHRTVYSRSKVFDSANGEEPRRLHLGIDIWGEAGTTVFAPLDGSMHSFAFNDQFGDYGATIILQHEINGYSFHSLYGHLSLKDLDVLTEGRAIKAGDLIAHFGEPKENGHWPPHLHFQLIIDMEGKRGDYPGVCKYSEREKYLANCPDPDLLLRMMQCAVNIEH